MVSSFASGLLEDSVGQGFSFFETATVGVPISIIGLIFYMTIGVDQMHKVYKFEEVPMTIGDDNVEAPEHMNRKMWLTLIVWLLTIFCLVFAKWNMAATCFAAVLIMVLLKVIDVKEAVAAVPWGTTLNVIFLLRMCRVTSIIEYKPSKTSISVVIVDEDLGLGWGRDWEKGRIDPIMQRYVDATSVKRPEWVKKNQEGLQS